MPERAPRPAPALDARLAALDAAGLRRTPRAPVGRDLTTNDVLGLSRDPAVREALIQALAFGVPHGGAASRLLRGDHPAWTGWEEAVAAWQGAPAARAFSTGYAANVGLMACLPEPGDLVVSDALNHASLIDGLRLSRAQRAIVPHGDLDAAAAALARHDGPAWIVVESVYSMDGDRSDLAGWADLADRTGARLIVDEAHATGLYGPEGQGRVVAMGLRDAVFASVHTFGKALGLAGAAVVGSEALADWLYNRARSFVFSTAPPPFLAAGLHAALGRVRADPALRARPALLADRLRAALGPLDTGPSNTHIVPVITGSAPAAMAWMAALATRGWDARAVRPPTVPEGASRLRLVMHAPLSDDDVDRLASDLLATAPAPA